MFGLLVPDHLLQKAEDYMELNKIVFEYWDPDDKPVEGFTELAFNTAELRDLVKEYIGLQTKKKD